jgi:3-mercaptopyruvate sulfurtransferase SseA
VARELMGMGYGKVFALKGGWREWKGAGYPVEAK